MFQGILIVCEHKSLCLWLIVSARMSLDRMLQSNTIMILFLLKKAVTQYKLIIFSARYVWDIDEYT